MYYVRLEAVNVLNTTSFRTDQFFLSIYFRYNCLGRIEQQARGNSLKALPKRICKTAFVIGKRIQFSKKLGNLVEQILSIWPRRGMRLTISKRIYALKCSSYDSGLMVTCPKNTVTCTTHVVLGRESTKIAESSTTPFDLRGRPNFEARRQMSPTLKSSFIMSRDRMRAAQPSTVHQTHHGVEAIRPRSRCHRSKRKRQIPGQFPVQLFRLDATFKQSPSALS